jgi:phosphate ABC transporter phosphate-binding protein
MSSFHRNNADLLWRILVFLLAAGISGSAQSATGLKQVKTLYVDSLGNGKSAVAMRDYIEHRLRKNHELRIATDPHEADAILKGTTRIWAIGRDSLSPRSHRPVEALFEGFVSVEMVGKNNETIWSYLVTPSRFPWGGITDDLGRQVISRLLTAIKETGQEPSLAAEPATAVAALKGAGATFPAPLYEKWFELFQEDHGTVHISYDPVGSAEGIRKLEEGKVDFGASDMPVTAASDSRGHALLRQIPMVLGAVVPIYNIAGLHQSLNFTPEILAAIYLGKIKKWNDSQIRKVNDSAPLPDADIVVAHRSDGSGTTFVWTDYLSKVSPDWKASVGSGDTVRWPVGIGAARNEGVASIVQSTPNSIGYVEFIYALQHELSFGAVRNAAGEFSRADIASVIAAARASATPQPNSGVSITGSPGRTAYPISAYTWLLLPEKEPDSGKKTALSELLHWMLTSGQKSCSALGYAPLPSDVAKRALEELDNL